MNLVVDVGNTLSKIYVFSGDEIVFSEKYEKMAMNDLRGVIERFPRLEYAIISCVGKKNNELFLYLKEVFKENFIIFDTNIEISIENDYMTPKTLGVDRLAAALGACKLYGKEENILIFDFGSAITIDFVEKGRYKGGNISLGASLRFKALNDYTEKLPLRKITDDVSLVGDSTNSAIENGVINSIIFEIEGYINRFETKYGKIIVIFTGGDTKYFANKLKNTIFAILELVPVGLNSVLVDKFKINA